MFFLFVRYRCCRLGLESVGQFQDTGEAYVFYGSTFTALMLLKTLYCLFVLMTLVWTLTTVVTIFCLNLQYSFLDKLGLPFGKQWLLNTLKVSGPGLLFYYFINYFADAYLFPETEGHRHKIKLLTLCVYLDLYFILTFGVWLAFVKVVITVVIYTLLYAVRAFALWDSTLPYPFQMTDYSYASYVSVVRMAAFARECELERMRAETKERDVISAIQHHLKKGQKGRVLGPEDVKLEQEDLGPKSFNALEDKVQRALMLNS